MAQINLGNFGGLVAQPAPMPRVGSVPNAAAEAISDLGEIGQQAALRQIQKDQQAERERRIQQDAADKIATASELARTREELRVAAEEVADGVRTGTIDKTKAPEVWEQRRGQVLQARTEAVPTSMRSLFEKGVAEAMAFPEAAVRKSVRDRDIADNRSGLLSFLEVQQREAVAGNPGARKAALDAITGLGGFAGFSPAEQQGLAQKFEEGVTYTRGYNLANSASTVDQLTDAEKQLKDNPEFAAMDPQRKAVLLNQIDDRRARLIQRARIEAERQARERDRVFTAAAAVFESGRAFSAEYGDQVLARLKGSPYESTVREMIKAGPQNAAAATLPIDGQRAQLDGLLARANTEGSNPALNQEIERRQKVLQAAERDIREDPLGAANERGIVPVLRPLNVADLRGLPQALAERREAAGIAAQWAGRPVSPLRQQEAEQVARVLQGLPPEQKAPALAAIGSALGDRDQIAALARQIDSNDRTLATAMMYANTRSTQGRYVSELILRGEQARKDGRVKVDTARETGWRAAIATQIGDAYADQELRQRYIDSAMSIAIGLAADGDADISRAVRLATGGIRTQADDTKVPRPYGWTDREFDRGLRDYPAGRLPEQLRVGNVAMSRDDFRARLPDALLVHAGQGRYRVRAGAGFVTDPQGRPVVLDFAAQ